MVYHTILYYTRLDYTPHTQHTQHTTHTTQYGVFRFTAILPDGVDTGAVYSYGTRKIGCESSELVPPLEIPV